LNLIGEERSVSKSTALILSETPIVEGLLVRCEFSTRSLPMDENRNLRVCQHLHCLAAENDCRDAAAPV